MKRAQISSSTTCSPTSDWPAIRWPWCSTATGSTRRRCRRSPREFNLSETVFILPPDNPRAPRQGAHLHAATTSCRSPAIRRSARRSRSPKLAGDGDGRHLRAGGKRRPGALRRHAAARARTFAEFDLPQLPEPVALSADAGGGRRGARPGSARDRLREPPRRPLVGGVPYMTVPVAGLTAAARVALDNQAWSELAPRTANGAVAARLRLLPRDGAPRQRLPRAHVRAGQSASSRTRRRARRWPPSPARSCISTSRSTASAATGSSRASRWAGRRASGWSSTSKAASWPRARIGGHAVKVGEGMLFV